MSGTVALCCSAGQKLRSKIVRDIAVEPHIVRWRRVAEFAGITPVTTMESVNEIASPSNRDGP
jgi:hypothetical protein